ncbi:hypothetical protein K9M41_04670 [Candidatus Gracilibacteria bacterium]|nr:hypothetical protein [Candidatus Gracilibacteria bacterium]
MIKILLIVFALLLTGCSIQSEVDGKTAEEWQIEYKEVIDELSLLQDKDWALENKKQCQKDGFVFHEKEMEGVTNPFVPRFRYSIELNTCLYKGGFISENVVNWLIKDIYSNEELASHYSEGGEDILIGLGGMSKEEFKNISKELGFAD